MGRVLGTARVEFLGVSLTDGGMPVMVQPGDRLEVISENGGFTFRHPDGLYYATQEQTVDEVLENVEREEVVEDDDHVMKPQLTPVEVVQPVRKITYEDNDDLLLIF